MDLEVDLEVVVGALLYPSAASSRYTREWCGMPACRSTVILARRIHHVIEGVFGPDWWPSWELRPLAGLHLLTASCSPWCLLVLNGGHLPIAILSIRLLILPLVIVVEVTGVGVVVGVVVVVVAVVLAPFTPTGSNTSCFCRMLLGRLLLNEAVDT